MAYYILFLMCFYLHIFKILYRLINVFVLFSENRLTSSEIENIVPGTASVFVNTWGCAHNSSDSEYMAGQLAAQVINITT